MQTTSDVSWKPSLRKTALSWLERHPRPPVSETSYDELLRRATFNAKQQEAFSLMQPGTTGCLAWGRGCGKTYFQDLAMMLLVATWDGKQPQDRPWRGVRIVFLMPSLTQFKKVHGAFFRSMETEWAFLRPKFNATTYEVSFPGGSSIVPFPACAWSGSRARGIRADVVMVDEADDVETSTYDAVVVPWFSRPGSLAITVVGGTPRRGKQGFLYRSYANGLDEEKADCWAVHAVASDCPGQVDAQLVARAKRDTPPAVFKREWLCDFDSAEGLVYGDVWDSRFHVRIPENLAWDDVIVAGDEGWENPGVLLLIGVLGKGLDAQYWVLEEIVQQHWSDDAWAEAARPWGEWYPRAKLYGDAAAPKLWERLKKTAGFRPQPVDKDIQEGIRAVATALHKRPGPDGDLTARLFVHPRCQRTIWEFGAYRRKADPQVENIYTEDVVKRDDHTMDALRYAVLSYGGRATRRLNPPIERRQ